MSRKLIVIGAGMAAGRMIEHLVADAPGAYDITLFNAEPRGTYNRIMLSPVLAGAQNYDDIVTHDAAFYDRHAITCRFGERVAAIDTDAKTVTSETGEVLPYDKLVFATGSQPVMLPMPGHDLAGVIAYRDLEDTRVMMALQPGQKAVVIGGGLLGLEAAAGMAARGVDVSVVHIMGHLMERQLDFAAGDMLKKSLEAKGITVKLEAKSQEIIGDQGRVKALRLEDGTELPCDLLCMAVGIRPHTELAKAAGLNVDRGIVVDDQMCSSAPDVLAIGECVEHRGALFGLVAPLFDQAKTAAATLLSREAAFVQRALSTKLKVTGCDLFSAGDFADGVGREDIVFRDPGRGVYKRLVIQDNRLIGAVIYGDTGDGTWFFNLIRDETDITDMRDMVIFGPAYQGGDTADPFSAAAASRLDRGCSGQNTPLTTPGSTFAPAHHLAGLI